jgi:hypothetical protein
MKTDVGKLSNHPGVGCAPSRPALPVASRRLRGRGITSAIAMIFMVLIGCLALGFYATMTTSTKLSENDQKGARALMAAESGIQFMRLNLAHVQLPPMTTPDQVLAELFADLKVSTQMIGNLGTNTVGFANGTISIPAEANQIIVTNAADNTGFRVTITRISPTIDGVVCTVTGHTGTGRYHRSKRVALDFTRQEIPSSLFDNAVAAQGKVTIMKGLIGGSGVPDTIANVLTTKTTAPAFQMSGGTLGGKIGIVKAGTATLSGGTVSGTSNLTTIYNTHVKLSTAPEFPAFDTSVFKPYASTTYVTGMTTLQNARIPANTGTTATPLMLAGGVSVQGILYIESPNVVQFGGNVTIDGFIVVENKNTSAENSLTFTGSATINPVPAGAMFDSVRAITGISILAPTTKVTMTGSTDSYFKGNVIVGSFNELGNATITMNAGSIVAMDTGNNAMTFNGKDTRFMSTGALNPPSLGVKYSFRFVPINGTYAEVN